MATEHYPKNTEEWKADEAVTPGFEDSARHGPAETLEETLEAMERGASTLLPERPKPLEGSAEGVLEPLMRRVQRSMEAAVNATRILLRLYQDFPDGVPQDDLDRINDALEREERLRSLLQEHADMLDDTERTDVAGKLIETEEEYVRLVRELDAKVRKTGERTE